MATLPILTLQGKPAGDLELPDAVFATALNGVLIQEAVLAYRAAGRAGTHATKNRSDVRGGGKKPWRQKKTGRSRHGSIRSPIWRGGGTVFGPKPHTYGYAFPRRKRQGALRSVLSMKLKEGKLVVVKSFELEGPKTKSVVELIGRLGITGSALLVDEPVGRSLELSARNLPGVKTTRGTALSIIDALQYDTIVLSAAAAGRVAEVLAP